MSTINDFLNKITIGNDIIDNTRIKLDDNFIKKVLSPEEIILFNNKNWTSERKKEFIAGRWAAKEAIFKATGIDIMFAKLNIYYKNDVPKIDIPNFYISISISHEKAYSIAHCLAISLTS